MSKTTESSRVKRTDICVLFDVTNGNPNGDPDRGNAPRRDPVSRRGIVTPMCLKRRIRDYIDERYSGQDGYEIYIRRNAVLSDLKRETKSKVVRKGGSGDELADRLKATTALSQRYFDVRAFGAVLSSSDKDADAKEVTGPIQFGVAMSVDPIYSYELGLTRVAAEKKQERQKAKAKAKAATKDEEVLEDDDDVVAIADDAEGKTSKDNKTMGSKHIVPYGLYRAHIFIDPVRARKPEIGFTVEDQKVFEEALLNMFADRSDGKSELTVRAIYVFEHESDYGTPDLNGPELLDLIEVKRKTSEPAQRFSDYQVRIPDPAYLAEKGITMRRLKKITEPVPMVVETSDEAEAA